MGEYISIRRAIRAACVVAVAGLVGACSGDAQNAAPVIVKGASPDLPQGMPARPPVASVQPGRQVVVRPGQSVGRLAQQYGVSKHAIIAANRLTPPYKIEIGQRLLIPGAAASPSQAAIAAAPLPPSLSPPPVASRGAPEVIPLDGPPPPPGQKPVAALTPPPPTAKPPAGGGPADEPRDAAETAPPQSPPPPPPAEQARGGQFEWPVRGRILAGYGAAQGGSHNDGINIAAARGAPVRAVDGGVVAYAGNEIRGYGNLVLVKHGNGFISAYAHCDELLVKRGEKVHRGQVIAKVGATGGVTEPQLHFELRRGKRAVDPREFLAPASNAEAGGRRREG